tara:strand:- start:44 stop:649 length:606 start_codon:yes stop_codon:yes gene_type:complete
MVNYNNGKIYKLVCDTTGLMYVGSTTKKYLSQRLDSHRSNYTFWKKHNKKYMTSYKVLENENYTIVLLELVNCNSNDELKARERFYIQSNVCVNKAVPLRTDKEYYEENQESINEYKKKWYDLNRTRISKIRKEYQQQNKEQIAKYLKEYQQKNKEQLADKQKIKFTCECGSTIAVSSKSPHLKSKKHLKYCQPTFSQILE